MPFKIPGKMTSKRGVALSGNFNDASPGAPIAQKNQSTNFGLLRGVESNRGTFEGGMRGGISPGSTPPVDAAAGDQPSELQQMYQDLISKAEGQWGNIESLQQANAAGLQRRAMAMQGAMGSAIGGGFAGAMGQAGLQGQQDMNAARLAHDQAINALRERALGAQEDERRYNEEQAWREKMYGDEQSRYEAELKGEEQGSWNLGDISDALARGEITWEEAQALARQYNMSADDGKDDEAGTGDKTKDLANSILDNYLD